MSAYRSCCYCSSARFGSEREGLLRFSVVMAALSFLISMGSRLHVWGHNTVIRLPFDVIAHLPVLKSEVASRYCLFMWLFIALSVAVILDRSRSSAPARAKLHGRGRLPKSSHGGRLCPCSSDGSRHRLARAGLALQHRPGCDPTGARAADGRRQHLQVGRCSPTRSPATPTTCRWSGSRSTASATGFRPERRAWPTTTTARPRQHSRRAGRSPCDRVRAAAFLCARAHDATSRDGRCDEVVIPLSDSINPMCAVRFVQAVLGRAPINEHGSAVWTDVDLGPPRAERTSAS